MIPEPGTILVATDFGPTSAQAVEYAAALARRFHSDLRVLHVIVDPFPSGPGWEVYVRDAEAIRERMLADAQQRMDRLVPPLIASGVRATSEFRHGDAADAILGAAAECHADLIVVGTHGRRGIAHALIGSVAERVVRQASCAVLAVRPQPAAAPHHRVTAGSSSAA